MTTQNNDLLGRLKNLVSESKEFTDKYFIDDAKISIQDYDSELYKAAFDTDSTGKVKLTNSQRLRYHSKLIFSNVEAVVSRALNKVPELLISGRGAQSQESIDAINSVYEYLKDVCDLESFSEQAMTWLVLLGNVFTRQSYEIKENNDQIEKHDPKTEVVSPFELYILPGSKFSNNMSDCLGVIRTLSMPKSEISELYGIDNLEGEDEITIISSRFGEEKITINGNVKVYEYTGKIQPFLEQLKKYNVQEDGDVLCQILFTDKQIIDAQTNIDMNYASARWFGLYSEFFGHGLGRALRSQQREASIKKTQILNYVDKHIHAHLLIKEDAKVSGQSYESLQRGKTILWDGDTPPTYLVPPALSPQVFEADRMIDGESQNISGVLDLSRGAQQTNVVKTATGQQIFADGQEVRIDKLRKSFARMYRQVIINLLKLAQKYWEDQKIITIVQDGKPAQVVLNKLEFFKSFDIETDIDVNLETVMANRQTEIQKYSQMYAQFKDDPQINQKWLRESILEKLYGIKDVGEAMAPAQNTQLQINPPSPSTSSIVNQEPPIM